jgi:signal transduction histidine kinase
VSLRTEVLLSVSLLMAVAIVLVAALTLQALQLDATLSQMLGKQRELGLLRAALGTLARGHEDRIPDSVRVEAQALLSAMAEEGMGSLFWVDAAGRTLAQGPSHTGPDPQMRNQIRSAIQLGREMTRTVSAGPEPDGRERPGRFTYTLPLFTAEGKAWAAVHLEAPIRGVWEGLLASGWVLLLYVGMVFLILILFGSYLIHRNVLIPLTRLTEASERISQGDYGLSWEGFPTHEMGRLAEALRRMAESLHGQRETLRQRMKDLEESHRALVQAQQALVRSEKLASVGRVAAGVAHEVGNPTGSLLGYVEILLREEGEPSRRDCLLRMRSEAERIQRIVRSLLDLARPGGRRWTTVDVAAAVDDTLVLLANHPAMRGIEVRWSPPGAVPTVWGDGDQLRQVILNLILNALDALDGVGRLGIEVGQVRELPDEGSLVPPPRRRGEPREADFTAMRRTPPMALLASQGPFVFVAVHDTGPGIPPDDLSQLFDPFFTTKEPGKGTGLGLTVVLGIVESYGGRIQVRSTPGQGSSFTVFLPVGRPPEEAGTPPWAEIPEAGVCSGRVGGPP